LLHYSALKGSVSLIMSFLSSKIPMGFG